MNRAITVTVACLVGAGCTGEDAKGELPMLGQMGDPVRWSEADDPSLIDDDLLRDINQLPLRGQVDPPPWPGSFWPAASDSIAYRWAGPTSESPAAKYQRAFGGERIEERVSQSFGILAHASARQCLSDFACDRRRGEICARRDGERLGSCIPSWYGICHAWAAAAALEPEPRGAVTVNNVSFRPNDIKALISLTYEAPAHRRVSLRCNKDDSQRQIRYDTFGRPVEADAECRDTNPGTFHLLLTNLVGIQQRALLQDRSFDLQVWTHPISGYELTQLREVDARQANALIGARGAAYRFNPDARRFVQVTARVEFVQMVDANEQTDRPIAGSFIESSELEYVLELDDKHQIIGGEWIGQSKKAHPDFLWVPTGVGEQDVADGAIRYTNVERLVDLAANAANETRATNASESGEPADPPAESASGSAPEHLDLRGYVGRGSVADYQLALTGGHAVTIETEAPADIDLYARYDALPRGRSYDAYSNGWTGNEELTFVAPHDGTLYITVHGYEASSYRLITQDASIP